MPKITKIPKMPYSYLIKKDGDYTVAYDEYGNEKYSGLDAATVIQAAIDALTSGGEIFFKRGTYPCIIRITNNLIKLNGEGPSLSILKLPNGTNDDLIANPDNVERDVWIHNLKLDGNKANNTAGNCINLDYLDVGSHNEEGLWNVIIVDAPQDGIHQTTAVLGFLSGSGFTIGNCAGDGMDIAAQGAIFGLPNWIYGNGGKGVSIHDCTDIIGDLVVEDNTGWGFHGYGIHNSKLNLWVSNNYGRGVVMQATNDASFTIQSSNNSRTDGSEHVAVGACKNSLFIIKIRKGDEPATTDGLNLYDDCSYSTFLLNINAKDYALVLSNVLTGVGIRVIGGALIGGSGSVSGSVPSGMKIKYNSGYVTENSETATILNTGTSVTFAHGLAGTPTLVTLGATHAEVSDAIWSADATNITITVPSAVTADRKISWYAEYKP